MAGGELIIAMIFGCWAALAVDLVAVVLLIVGCRKMALVLSVVAILVNGILWVGVGLVTFELLTGTYKAPGEIGTHGLWMFYVPVVVQIVIVAITATAYRLAVIRKRAYDAAMS